MLSVSSTYEPVSLSRASPPVTPPLTPTVTSAEKASNQAHFSPALSDDSILELSFAYERNAEGEWVRVSKGSSKSSPPASSSEHHSPHSNATDSPRLDSPVPSSSARRSSLSRSESVPLIDTASTSRTLQRVTSGPVNFPTLSGQASTPAASSTRATLLSAASGTGRKIGGARRVRLEEFRESNERAKAEVEEIRQRELKMQIHEKENVEALPTASSTSTSSYPLSEIHPVPQRPLSVQGRQVLPVPSRRLVKKIEPISEAEDVEEEAPPRSHSALSSSSGIRPRRSASLSEAQEGLPPPQFHHFPRPGSSGATTTTTRGARRVTIEEKIRQEREIALEEGYALREAEEAVEAERRALALAEMQTPAPTYTRHSPSPTHLPSHMYPNHTHQRKESDTLRSIGSALVPASSPTAVEMLASRVSPPNLGISTNVIPMARHRRSPGAPESAGPASAGYPGVGKTWSDIQESEPEQNPDDGPQLVKNAPSMLPPPIPVQQVQSAPAAQNPQQARQQQPGAAARNMVVNRKSYVRLDMIGKGGSSRVYRVLTTANEIYAIKRVSLDKTDAETMNGYMNEIALLKRLEGNSRIIRLIDSEVKAGPGGSKGYLMLVMECGEIDLARLLQEQQKEPLDLVWVSYYWKQMLQAVQVIHEEKIVHSDLKPANFVLVRGQLKLIDFGIANAIANDTTNIHRDSQIGTVNYMSPEAIELPDGMRRHKVGRQSDVWSLGCILYQMVYGQPPFQHLSVYQKMKAIPDESHVIEFPEYSTPSIPRVGSSSPPRKLDHLKVKVPRCVINTIKSCLIRGPKERTTIPALLAENWLTMRDVEPVPMPPPAPSSAPALKEDETIINPYFMQQLLRYGISLGSQGSGMEGEDLLKEAERLVAELKSVHASAPS